MGSMKRKRRKKLAKAWKEFQAKHELNDIELKRARATGCDATDSHDYSNAF